MREDLEQWRPKTLQEWAVHLPRLWKLQFQGESRVCNVLDTLDPEDSAHIYLKPVYIQLNISLNKLTGLHDSVSLFEIPTVAP